MSKLRAAGRLLAELEARGGTTGAFRRGLALKAFSMFALAPLVRRYLSGTCASGLYEARLGREEFGGEVHTFCAAWRDADFAATLAVSDHLVFNSVRQWHHFRDRCLAARERRPELRFGLRINPRHSEGATPLYDPCAPGSRLGITRDELADANLDGISGLHFHTLCEQDLPPLARTLAAVEDQFGTVLERMEWINFGGGHHITRADYQVDALIDLIREFRARRGLAVYLEPGEAVALNTGVLVAEVLDLKHNELDLAILDVNLKGELVWPAAIVTSCSIPSGAPPAGCRRRWRRRRTR